MAGSVIVKVPRLPELCVGVFFAAHPRGPKIVTAKTMMARNPSMIVREEMGGGE